jgi:hypothetical protein
MVLAAAGVMLVIALALVWAGAKNAITVCVAEVNNGKISVTRGGLAPRVLADVADVVKRPKVKHARLRVVRAKDHARLEARGDLSDDQLQRLRNVIGTVPLAQLTKKKKG